MPNENYILRLLSINKSFKSPKGRVDVLKDISIDVKRGEVLCLVGPNGAGKSTLLRIIAGLILPDSGRVLWSNYSFNMKTIFIGSSERGFYYRLSGIDNLRFFLNLAGVNLNEKSSHFSLFVEQLKLTSIIGKRYQTYSTGERQRFALLYAILSKPSLFIIDEFTQSVDVLSQKDLTFLLRDNIGDNNGAVIATHQISIMKDVADRIAFIKGGRLIAVGRPDEISSKYFQSGEFRIIVYGDGENIKRVNGLLITGLESHDDKTVVDVQYNGGLGDLIGILEKNGLTVISAEMLDSDINEIYRRAIE